jgi:NADH-quinone oxidoreductase subunit G
VPVYQIFGSEELSSGAPAVAERIQSPFVLMNKQDAERIGKKEDNLVTVYFSHKSIEVKLKIDNTLPSGIAGLSFGMPGMPFVDLPTWGKFVG